MNVVVSVADLDLADGIAPTFVINPNPQNTTIGISATDRVRNVTSSMDWASAQWMAAHAMSVSTLASTANAEVGTNFLLSSGVATQDGGAFSAYPQAPYFGASSFSLGAHSRLTISGTASIFIAMDERRIPGSYTGPDEVSAAAGAFIYVSPSIRSVDGYYLSQTISKSGLHDAVNYVQSLTITSSIVNDSASTMSGQFYLYASTYGSAAVLAVPEPSSAHVMLGGMLVLVAATRLRQRYIALKK